MRFTHITTYLKKLSLTALLHCLLNVSVVTHSMILLLEFRREGSREGQLKGRAVALRRLLSIVECASRVHPLLSKFKFSIYDLIFSC